MIISHFLRNFEALFISRVSLELISGPGVGKSSSIHQGAGALSRRLKAPVGVMTMICSGLDPADVRGFLFPLKGESGELMARFTRPSVFPSPWNVDVYVDGARVPDYDGELPQHGIVFFDEFGQADNEVKKPLGQLILDHHIGEYRLPEGWVTWMASNRVQDRSGVVKELMFLQNRRMQIAIEPSYEAWEDWAMRQGIHPLVVSFAKRQPSYVFREEVPKEPGPFCTPRSLVLCGQTLLSLRRDEHGTTRLPDDHIATEVVQGWLGDGTMPVFMSHIRLANDLPEIDDVAKNPKTLKVPERVDAQYVMAMTLAHHITKKTAGAFITYINRFDKELQILFATNAVRRGPDVLNVPEFKTWISVNKDLALIAFG